METKIPDLSDARKFSEGVTRLYPDQMLAYNLSPSFNWDAAGMNDDEIATFNDDLGQLGYVRLSYKETHASLIDLTTYLYMVHTFRSGSLLRWQVFIRMV